MSLTHDQIQAFYDGIDYWPANRFPCRPKELHLPLILSKIYEESLKNNIKNTNKGLVLQLNKNQCKDLAPVLLHESLFHFYKGFYNYLAARSLYFGGMQPWINVSLYYAKLFFAKSISILAGKQSYGISENKEFFIKDISNQLAGRKSPKPYYSMRLDIDIEDDCGKINFNNEGIKSHKVVWKDYSELHVENLGLFSLLSTKTRDNGELDIGLLSDERNRENYTFDGYMQLDFNLPLCSFQQYFERDQIKYEANKIYDFRSCDVLLAFSSQLRLFRKFKIDNMPIEKEKFAYMIDYCLPESEAKHSLLMLCNEGFPTRNLFSDDGIEFYDELRQYL
ncbi:MAG: hypothetical protein NTX42_02255 [Methanothrix sp.]|nr:hypothetical protein [Methanothrix sp.]